MSEEPRLVVIIEDVKLPGVSQVIFHPGEVIVARPVGECWNVTDPQRFAWLTFCSGEASIGYTLLEAAAYLTDRLGGKPVHVNNVAEWNRAGLFPRVGQQTGIKGRGGKRWIVPLVDLDAFRRPKPGAQRVEALEAR